jgi:hypothetical protein
MYLRRLHFKQSRVSLYSIGLLPGLNVQKYASTTDDTDAIGNHTQQAYRIVDLMYK